MEAPSTSTYDNCSCTIKSRHIFFHMPDLADRAPSGLDLLPLEVVRQLQRTKIRQLRMGDEEVKWVSKEVSWTCSIQVHLLDRTFFENQGLFWFRSIRKSHPLRGPCCCSSKEDVMEQGNSIESCRHWLCDEMGKNECIICAELKALRSSCSESESNTAG